MSAPTRHAPPALDVAALRAQVPALAAGTAHFDGPGGTQTPTPVIEAISAALAAPLSNRGGPGPGGRNADDIVLAARAAVADLLAVDPGAVVFGRSATQLTYDLARTLARTWSPGDEVVVTRLDHDANTRPWVQAAAAVGATVRWAGFDPETGELVADDVRAVLSERTVLVALTAASNLIGTRPPVAEVAAAAHAVGAAVHVDAVHSAAHTSTDLAAMGADTLVCSPYKFLGPHLGVLAGRVEALQALAPDKLLPSSDAVPERFELGTLPYELLAGTTAAIDVLAGLAPSAPDATRSRRERLLASYAALGEHEAVLLARLEAGLAALPGVAVRSRAARRTPTLLITLAGRSTAEASAFLAGRGVVAPSGSFYAIEASRHLGLGDAGGLRVGLAPYTDASDVDRLLDGLAAFLGG